MTAFVACSVTVPEKRRISNGNTFVLRVIKGNYRDLRVRKNDLERGHFENERSEFSLILILLGHNSHERKTLNPQ